MSKNKIWIWEDDNYPNFAYDNNTLNPMLVDVANNLGILEGTIKHLSGDTKHKIFTESILDEIVYNFSKAKSFSVLVLGLRLGNNLTSLMTR